MRIGIIAIVIMIALQLITPLVYSMNSLSYEKVFSTVVYAPAVTSEEGGAGVLSRVTLYIAYPGGGRVFFTANPLTELDTQATARIAAFVATSLAGINYFDYDYYVIMESNTMIIGGPSAGALMTIGFLSMLLNKTIYPNVTMTGMIYPDGMIGPVGGLKEKLEAAARAGFKVFLIPLGERIITVPNVTVRRYPWGVYRSISYYKLDLVEYGKDLGVQVVEVASIREAFKYFTGYTIECRYNMFSYELGLDLKNLFAVQARKLLDNASNSIASAKALLNSLELRYRSYILELIDSVESMIPKARSYLDKGYVLLAVNNAFRANYMAIYINWLVNTIIDRNSIDRYVDLVNNTLINTSNLIEDILNNYYRSGEISLSRLEILVAMDIRFLDAKHSFSKALKEIESDIINALSSLSYSYVRARSVVLWSDIYDKVQDSALVNRTNVILASIMLYSMADNVLSYALTLSQDLGVKPDLLNKALEYMEKANSAYKENDTLAFTGELLYATSYSMLAIYKMFSLGPDIDSKLAYYLANESKYTMCSLQTSSFLPIYYYSYGNEALNNNEYEDAYISYTMSILFSRLSWLVRENIEANIILVQSNPYIPIRSPHTNKANVLVYNSLEWLLIGIVIGLCIALIPLIIIYRRKHEISLHVYEASKESRDLQDLLISGKLSEEENQ